MLNKISKPIHLSHILFFMFLTWGNFVGFIFSHLEF